MIIVTNAIIAMLINIYQMCSVPNVLEQATNTLEIQSIMQVFRIIYIGAIILNLIIVLIGLKNINKTIY